MNQELIREYWDALISSDSEDAFRYLVEMPNQKSVTEFVLQKYKNTKLNDEKNTALEVLRELRNSSSESAIQEVALTAQNLEEWKSAVEARIYSDENTALDFIKKERARFESDGDKAMIIECEYLIDELTV